jgi:cytochrome c oxidase assembly factor 2
MIRATARTTISRSIFSTTFLVAFSLVLANSLVPCPVDRNVANDSQITKKQREEIIEKN